MPCLGLYNRDTKIASLTKRGGLFYPIGLISDEKVYTKLLHKNAPKKQDLIKLVLVVGDD